MPAGGGTGPAGTGRLRDRKVRPIHRVTRPIAGARGDFWSSRRCLGTADSDPVSSTCLLHDVTHASPYSESSNNMRL